MEVLLIVLVAVFVLSLRMNALVSQSTGLGKLILRGRLITGSVSPNNAWIHIGDDTQRFRVRAERERMGDVVYELMYEAVSLKEKPIVEFRGNMVADDNGEKFFLADGFKVLQ